jgi:hypothetical protein
MLCFSTALVTAKSVTNVFSNPAVFTMHAQITCGIFYAKNVQKGY